ncbi:D-alanyl-D-alanine carboxypeptidase/D-alanyl-D-alanine-endopeptidase [Amycolatopsis sp. K13G38]|uniref:D-alanyl-D-alanine carboxypeptidase/D-alanyl-D-alanine-endopeptidase n=1 Tax=Amycolatopsis acididurans TaxID=2724524 RepID=A0ABX1JEY3_9PSEU|nr:D-alanyl-D-alanine carboxypeptidase/D-alanyl-D-alanine-endopeptidase [Amycolatopsis acididurans]NKQ58352.1 D-alanyl-D-alanine carboxypeptidase/D-alanyl-D-alanine-endopeptidase [Amycolatopsis acididurans]
MPPHEDEPLWPSDDSDATSEADGGATAHLPLPGKQEPSARPEEPGEGTQRSGSQPPPESAGERTQFLQPWARQPQGPPDQPQPRQSEPAQQPRPQPEAESATAYLPLPESPAGQSRPEQRPGPAQPALGEQPTMFVPRVTDAEPPAEQRPVVPPAGIVHAQPMRIEPSGELRPDGPSAENEAPPAAPAAETAAETEPRRKRRGLIYSGAALVLVIVVGVALALPYVSNRLGLPWAPNLPKGDTPESPTVNLALQAPSSTAATPTSSGVGSALAGPAANPALGTLTGIVIDPATGSTLWNHNSGQLLTPASTTKLLTTSAALLQLDHGLQLTTKVVQGSSPDTAILVAGGDITLSALPQGKDSVYQGAAHLDTLVNQVKQASGGTIKKVQIDLSAYTGATSAPGWAPEDTPSTYATQIVPGMLDGGMTDPNNDESKRTANPAGDLLQTFAQRMGATVAPASTTTAPQGAKVLGEVKSAPITELIAHLLERSDNELAEVVSRTTAISVGKPASFAGGAQTTLDILSRNGFDVSGVSLNDGSGLSTLNKVPARLLAQLLSVAAAPDGKDPRTEKLRPLLEGLPVAGGSGTLSDRYGDPNSSAGKGWVRAKTGTLSGVNTLAGVVLDKDGRVLTFALMSNGSDIAASRPALDAIAANLRGCGCR